MAAEQGLQNGQVLTIPESVLLRAVDGETVLLNMVDEHYFGVDGVGTRLFELLAEPMRVDEVLAQLLDEYDVDEATLRSDLEQFVGELAAAGLIVVGPR